jgi:hypothetical protein
MNGGLMTDGGDAPAGSGTPPSPRAAAAWIALFVAGQLAAFRLTTLVPWAAYPHLADWATILASRRLELAVLLGQTVAVTMAASRASLMRSARRAAGRLGVVRAVVIVSIVAMSLAIPTQSGARFAMEVVLAGWIVAIAMGTLVLAARALPASALDGAGAWLDARLTIRGTPDAPRRWDQGLPWALSGWILVASAAMAWFVLEGVPHIDDSVAYLFQAKTFALGRLSVAPPPDSVSFTVPHLLQTEDAWFAKYFPGWPAFLSLGVLARAAWLVNPVLAAGTILLVHALVLRLYDRGTANIVALLLAASPWLITSSSGMMSHPSALFCGALALLAIEQQRDRRPGWWSVAAGAALGMLFLVRPPDAAALGVVAALWALGLRGPRLSSGSLAAIALVAAGVAALSLPYNAALTGNATLPPHRVWSDVSFGPNVDVFGFGPEIGIPLWRDHDPLPGHGLADVAIHGNRNLYLLSSELFGWAPGSLWLLLAGLLVRRSWPRADLLMVGIVAAVGLLHMAYWYPGGPDFGPRFWYLMIVPFAVFTVHGAMALGTQLAAATGGRHGGRRVGAAMVIASLTALLAGLPWRATAKYHRYRDIGADVRTLASGGQWRNALVFVDATDRADYQSAFNFLSPTLDGEDPVFALDAGPLHRRDVLRRFPERPVWVIGRPPDRSNRLVILGGPFPPGEDPLPASR